MFSPSKIFRYMVWVNQLGPNNNIDNGIVYLNYSIDLFTIEVWKNFNDMQISGIVYLNYSIDLFTIEVWKNFNDMQIRFINKWAVRWWYLAPYGAEYRPLGGGKLIQPWYWNRAVSTKLNQVAAFAGHLFNIGDA